MVSIRFEIIGQGYGADALRTYLMFAAPLDLDSRWDPQGVPATHRFLSRIWNLVQEFLAADPKSKIQNPKSTDVLRAIHPTIKKVTEDLEDQKYNTAIAAMMKCVNDLYLFKKDGFADHDTWQFTESLVASSRRLRRISPTNCGNSLVTRAAHNVTTGPSGTIST